MKWLVDAKALFGTKDDFVYRFMTNRIVEAETCGEAIIAVLRDEETKSGRPVLGLWDLLAVEAREITWLDAQRD
jgi:hypothetical protein